MGKSKTKNPGELAIFKQSLLECPILTLGLELCDPSRIRHFYFLVCVLFASFIHLDTVLF